MEWMAKHRFGAWKLVDMDNWLVGNPLVIPKHKVSQESVLDHQGTGFERPSAENIMSEASYQKSTVKHNVDLKEEWNRTKEAKAM